MRHALDLQQPIIITIDSDASSLCAVIHDIAAGLDCDIVQEFILVVVARESSC